MQVFGLAGLLKNVTSPCLEARNFDARSDDEIVTPERVEKMRTRFILRPYRALIVHRIKPRASLALHPGLTYFALSGLVGALAQVFGFVRGMCVTCAEDSCKSSDLEGCFVVWMG